MNKEMITVNPDCSTDVSLLIGEAIKIILLQSMDFLSSERTNRFG